MEIQAVSQVNRSEQLNQQTQQMQSDRTASASKSDVARFDKAMTANAHSAHQTQATTQAQQVQAASQIREIEKAKRINRVQVVDAKQLQYINETQAGQCVADGSQDGCLGDAILESLDDIRKDSRAELGSMRESLKNESLSSQELLKIQFDMNNWMMKKEVFSKTSSSVQRSIDTLFKAQ